MSSRTTSSDIGSIRTRVVQHPPPQQQRSSRLRRTRRLPVLTSLLILLPLYIFLPWGTNNQHWRLPEPKTELFDIYTGQPQLSEKAILEHARVLSEDIGFRTVGTREHALGDKYVLDQAKLIVQACEDAVKAAPTRQLECEVWRQEGSGTHRFDMMNKPVFKVYENLSNIVLRISDGTRAGKQHALLLNAHVDSTIPSPGAADDALSVGVLLEIARVLVNTPDWAPKNAIVFLFNNAEESLQDGSHLFATQSPIANTIRAVVNLEAAGNTGPEILFQATSEEMILAYSKVPYPYATVLANDVFQSGILLSDTDFRQFQEYQNLTGLDMAVVGDSYLYHTRKDLVKHIEAGVAQHFAENVMAIIRHLTFSSDNSLAKLATQPDPPTSLYFSVIGRWFFLYSAETAWLMLGAILASSVLVLAATSGDEHIGLIGRASVGVLGSLFGAVLGAGIAASIMAKLLGAGMSWYKSEYSCFLLYGPPAMAGALAAHYLLTSRSSPVEAAQLEFATLWATHFVNVFAAIALQAFNLGSSSVFMIFALGSLFALLLNTFLNAAGRVEWTNVHLTSYAVAQVVPLVIGTELAIGLLAIFVPLTGRMGEVAPVEHIIAIMASVLGFFIFSFALPIVHRLRRSVLLSTIGGLLVASAIVMAGFAVGSSPFDAMHQKRMFVLHYEDLNSGEHSLHLASADGAPGFHDLVHDIANTFSEVLHRPMPIHMDDHNPSWDIIYPFSQFLTPYEIDLPRPYNYISPYASTFTVTATNDVVNHRTGTRSLTLVIDHPGVIWTTIAFDAHILKWSIDTPPEPKFTRHHIKEASFYGVDQWTLDLVIAFKEPRDWKLKIDFMGIMEKGSWPGKKLDGAGTPAMQLFEALDGYIFERTADSVDVMLIGCVGGQAIV